MPCAHHTFLRQEDEPPRFIIFLSEIRGGGAVFFSAEGLLPERAAEPHPSPCPSLWGGPAAAAGPGQRTPGRGGTFPFPFHPCPSPRPARPGVCLCVCAVCVCVCVCACVPGCLPRASRERRRCPLIPALVLVRGRQERGAALGTAAPAPAPAPARRPPARRDRSPPAAGREQGAGSRRRESGERGQARCTAGSARGERQREREGARGESPRRWLPGSRLQPPLPRRLGEARPGWRLPRGARLCACPRPPSRSYLISR